MTRAVPTSLFYDFKYENLKGKEKERLIKLEIKSRCKIDNIHTLSCCVHYNSRFYLATKECLNFSFLIKQITILSRFKT